MKLHHIGIAVNNIEDYYENYLKPYFGYNQISNIIDNSSQHSRIAFAENGQSVKLELIEAIDEESPTFNILNRGNGGLYHMGYVSDDFENDILKMREKRFILISNKEGVAFLMSPSYEIFELLDGSNGWK